MTTSSYSLLWLVAAVAVLSLQIGLAPMPAPVDRGSPMDPFAGRPAIASGGTLSVAIPVIRSQVLRDRA